MLLALGLLATACNDDGSRLPPELAGGVRATFDVEGETFRLWTTNPLTIQGLFDLQAGTSRASIPNGPLLAGPGRGDHNLPWSWHLDPEDTEMAENTVEVCSGRPSFVEEELQAWLELGRYCPWSAELTELEDFRER
jgi:hypothetical protein